LFLASTQRNAPLLIHDNTHTHTRAYGKVYKAEHKDTGFILAIKCIPIPEELAEDAEKARAHASFTCAALRS
jgi:transcriptional regulator of aromatic amino acid metabolism